jgi:hypothetical protein
VIPDAPTHKSEVPADPWSPEGLQIMKDAITRTTQNNPVTV